MKTFSNPIFKQDAQRNTYQPQQQQNNSYKVQPVLPKQMGTIIEQDSENFFNTFITNQEHRTQVHPQFIPANQYFNYQPINAKERILSSDTDESSRQHDSLLDKYNYFINDNQSQRGTIRLNNNPSNINPNNNNNLILQSGQKYQLDYQRGTQDKNYADPSLESFLNQIHDKENDLIKGCEFQNYGDLSFEKSLINIMDDNNNNNQNLQQKTYYPSVQQPPQTMGLESSTKNKENIYKNAITDINELAGQISNLADSKSRSNIYESTGPTSSQIYNHQQWQPGQQQYQQPQSNQQQFNPQIQQSNSNQTNIQGTMPSQNQYTTYNGSQQNNSNYPKQNNNTVAQNKPANLINYQQDNNKQQNQQFQQQNVPFSNNRLIQSQQQQQQQYQPQQKQPQQQLQQQKQFQNSTNQLTQPTFDTSNTRNSNNQYNQSNYRPYSMQQQQDKQYSTKTENPVPRSSAQSTSSFQQPSVQQIQQDQISDKQQTLIPSKYSNNQQQQFIPKQQQQQQQAFQQQPSPSINNNNQQQNNRFNLNSPTSNITQPQTSIISPQSTTSAGFGLNSTNSNSTQSRSSRPFSYQEFKRHMEQQYLNGKKDDNNQNIMTNSSSNKGPISIQNYFPQSTKQAQTPQNQQLAQGQTNPNQQTQQQQQAQQSQQNVQFKFPSKQIRKLFTHDQKGYLRQAEDQVQESKIANPFDQKVRDQEMQNKQNQNQQQKQIQNNKEDDLPVFCINCEQFINLSEVDTHSQTNCKKKSHIINNNLGDDIGDIIQDINEKIQYVLDNLHTRTQDREIQPMLKQKIEEMTNNIQKIQCNNTLSVEINKNIVELHKQQALIQDGTDNLSMTVQILVQRAIVLGEEKSLKVKYCVEVPDPEVQNLENELRQLDKFTQKEKANLEFWKFQSEMMEEIKKNDIQNLKFLKKNKAMADVEVLSNIHSDVDSDNQSSAGFTTSSEFGIQISNPISYNAGSSGEEQKRLFYSEAVSVKLNLPPNHPGRDVIIADLYNEAMLKKLNKNEWEKFIKQKLNSM